MRSKMGLSRGVWMVLAGCLMFASTARAVLTIEYLVLGTFLNNSVEGTLKFNGGPNQFSPSTVLFGVGPEFQYTSGQQIIAADFTGPALNLAITNPGSTPFEMTFKSNVFKGLTLQEVAGTTLPGGVTGSLVDDLITIDYGGTTQTGAFAASFSLAPASGATGTSVPLPAGVLPGLVVGAGILGRKRLRRRG